MKGKKSLALSKVYGLLEPGPVVLVTTAINGEANIMTLSWQTMLDFEPPLLGCVLSNRNYSFAALKKTKQCVINIPTVELAKAVVGCGNTSGRSVDKFAQFHLTPVPAVTVDVPLIAECYANFECRVVDSAMVNKYNFFVLEVQKAWCSTAKKEVKTIHHCGKGVFVVDGKKIKLPSRMK